MRSKPEATKLTIRNRLENGKSSRRIADDLGVSKSLVDEIRILGSDNLPIPKAGAPQKLKIHDKNYVVCLIKRAHAATAVEDTKMVNQGLTKPVSAEIVRIASKEVANLVAKKEIRHQLSHSTIARAA